MAARKTTAKDLADKAKVEDNQDESIDKSVNQQEDADKRLQQEVLEKQLAQKEAQIAAAKKATTKAKAAQPEFEAVVSSRGYVTAYTKG